jgi:hypothetical protein
MVEVIMKGIKITIDSPDIIRWPETDFKVCVSICNTAEDRRGIFIKEISIQAGGVILGSTAVGRKLPSISEEYAVAQTLIEKPYYQKMKLWRFLNYSTCSFTFNIDLKAVKPDLCFEDSINLAAIISVIKEGKEERLNVSREVVYSQSLQKLPGWVAGDPHVHTRFSDALPWCTVKRQALACKKAGFDWVIITDHDDLLDPVAYARERLQCRAAEKMFDIAVLLGEEVTTTGGDVLVYDAGCYISRWKGNSQKNGQELFDELRFSRGICFIAHPFRRDIFGDHRWKEWQVTGYTGLEILNGRCSELKALQAWDRLAWERGEEWRKIGEQRWVGIGGSDAHHLSGIGRKFTFVFTGGSTSHSSIIKALQFGYAVASNGPLVDFTVKGKHLGETVTLQQGERVFLVIRWPMGQKLDRLRVVMNGRTIHDLEVTPFENSTHSIKIHVTVQGPGFVRIEGMEGNRTAYTNPIFVELR